MGAAGIAAARSLAELVSAAESARIAAGSLASASICVGEASRRSRHGLNTATSTMKRINSRSFIASVSSKKLIIPSDFHDTLLLEMVLARTERRKYGRNDFPKEMYEREKKRFVSKYQRMKNSGEVGYAIPREC